MNFYHSNYPNYENETFFWSEDIVQWIHKINNTTGLAMSLQSVSFSDEIPMLAEEIC